MQVERYRGYDVVHCAIDDSYSVWKDGQQIAKCRTRDLGKCISSVEAARTHFRPAAPSIPSPSYGSAIEDWFANLPARRVIITLKVIYYTMLAAWMAFAVYLFLVPLFF